MPRIWDAGRKEEITARLGRLQPEMRPKWGKLTPARMLDHCAKGMQAGLGELPVAPKNTPLRHFPLKQLVIYVLPWPESAPTAPELLADAQPGFEDAKTRLLSTLSRFVERGPQGRFAPHAAFGNLSGKDWGALTYRHLDHHWRQFSL